MNLQSELWSGLKFTGRLRAYENADTWYPSWAADGQLYSPYTDGEVGGVRTLSTWNANTPPGAEWDAELTEFFGPLGVGGSQSKPDRATTTGNAVLIGDSPWDLTIQALPPTPTITPRFHGLYPAGSLCYRGHWYYLSYYVQRWLNPAGERITYELGPVAGCRISADNGRSWTPSPLDDERPLFPERGRAAGEAPIRLGAPHFVDFGRDMEHSPDGHAYLVGHGTDDLAGIANWCSGDAAFLARVRPSPATINDPHAYSFFAGTDAGGAPRWSADFRDIRPILRWPGHCGIVNMTYHPGLRRYFAFLCVGPARGCYGETDTWIVEAPQPWGPFRTVGYWPRFGSQAYFVCVPSKFLSPDNTTLVLFWSANWTWKGTTSNPPGSRYALCAGEFQLRHV